MYRSPPRSTTVDMIASGHGPRSRARGQRGVGELTGRAHTSTQRITRLKTEDGGPMDVAGATLAAAAIRAGLIDEYAIVTHPVLVGCGTPFFTALDNSASRRLRSVNRP